MDRIELSISLSKHAHEWIESRCAQERAETGLEMTPDDVIKLALALLRSTESLTQR